MPEVSSQDVFNITILLICFANLIAGLIDIIQNRTFDIQIVRLKIWNSKIEKQKLKQILIQGNYFRLLISISLPGIMLLSEKYVTSIFLLFLIFYKTFTFYIRRLSMDMSDSLEIIILLGLVFSSIVDVRFGIMFITLNILILYFFTGYNKLHSKEWIEGQAFFDVINTETFGNYKIASVLVKSRFLSSLVSWSAILLQVSFPLCLVNENVCIVYLSLGIGFHFVTMNLMKLHGFFLVFIASYPSIYYASLYVNDFFVEAYWI